MEQHSWTGRSELGTTIVINLAGGHVILMKPLIVLAASFLCLSADMASTAEALTAKQLEALPTVHHGVRPELRVRWRDHDSDRELALIATFSSDRGIPLFNPFGDVLIGCPYQIVLTDKDLNHVLTIFDAPDALKSVPPPEYWVSTSARSTGGRWLRGAGWTPGGRARR